jgi:hypothetical protein
VTHSEQINEIATAMAKAQGKIEGAAKAAKNPAFKQGGKESKYADLASVWDACRDQLATNGIAVIQAPRADGPKVTVETMLTHSSGQWMKDELTMTAQQGTPQAIGSAITYARRYALAAMVGVAPADDDGNAASGVDSPAGRPEPTHAEHHEAPATNVDKVKAKVQAANGKPDPAKQILGEAIVALGNEKDAKTFLAAQRGEKVGSPVTEDELPGLRAAIATRKQQQKNVNDAAGILSAQH